VIALAWYCFRVLVFVTMLDYEPTTFTGKRLASSRNFVISTDNGSGIMPLNSPGNSTLQWGGRRDLLFMPRLVYSWFWGKINYCRI